MIDLSKLSDIEIYNLWEKGNSYWQVSHALTDEKILKRQKELSELSHAHSLNKHKQLTDPTGKPPLVDLIKLFLDDPYKDEKNKINNQLHWNVIHALKSGKIIALGFEIPRKITSRPIEIPTDVIENGKNTFSGISAKRNTVEKGKIKIEDIRFIWRRLVDTALSRIIPIKKNGLIIEHDPQAIKAKTLPENSPKILPQKAGRKSRRQEILNAFKALSAEKKVTIDTSSTILSHLIREHIFLENPEQTPSDAGLSDETIRRIVRSTK